MKLQNSSQLITVYYSTVGYLKDLKYGGLASSENFMGLYLAVSNYTIQLTSCNEGLNTF